MKPFIETTGISLERFLDITHQLHELPPDASTYPLPKLEELAAARQQTVEGLLGDLMRIQRSVTVSFDLDGTGVPRITPMIWKSPFTEVYGTPYYEGLLIGKTPLETCNNIRALGVLPPEDVVLYGVRAHGIGLQLGKSRIPWGGNIGWQVQNASQANVAVGPWKLRSLSMNSRKTDVIISPSSHLVVHSIWNCPQAQLATETSLDGLDTTIRIISPGSILTYSTSTYIDPDFREEDQKISISQGGLGVSYYGDKAGTIVPALIKNITNTTDFSPSGQGKNFDIAVQAIMGLKEKKTN